MKLTLSTILDRHFPSSHAFVIGNNVYDHFQHLNNAVNDALGIAAVLQEKIHGFQVHAPLLNATFDELVHLLEKTMPEVVGQNDRVFFYFAGHGIADESEQEGIPRGFLLPRDARPNDTNRSFPMDRLRTVLETLHCRHCLIVLDCCFSGAFRWASVAKRGVFYQRVPKKIYQERFDRYVVDPAWQVITSSAHDQEALDGVYGVPIGTSRNKNKSENSPFARHFMDALKGEADLIPKDRPDGLITASELYLYLRNKLEEETISIADERRQTPGFFYLPRHDKGEYLFLSPKVELNLPGYDPNINPYKGLQAYEREDRARFFGRDEVIESLAGTIRNQTFTVVTGASGTGKSSLVKAGVIPLLEDEGFKVIMMQPGVRPTAHFRKLSNSATPDEGAPILLFVDQFEEVFTQCHNEDERNDFLVIVKETIEGQHPYIKKVILTIRSDFEPQFEDTVLHPYWRGARFLVPAFSALELREIIERPAIQRIILFDPPELVDYIVQEVQNAPGALPLLSFTMSELYEKLKERGEFGAFKREDYLELGGVIGSLRTRADALYQSLDPLHQRTMQKLMLRMVSYEGRDLVKKRVEDNDLIFLDPEENKRIKTVLQQLVNARLIVRGKDMDGQPYVEPAHDALVQAWGALWSWIMAVGNDKLMLINKLNNAATDYQATQNRRDLWHNNTRLDAVYEEKDRWLNAREVRFVEESRRIRRRNRNRLLGTLVTIIAVLAVLVFVAQNNAAQARTASEKEAEQRQLAEDNLLKYQQETRARLVESYQKFVSQGDRLKEADQFEEAIAEYEKALEIIALSETDIDSAGATAQAQKKICEGLIGTEKRYYDLLRRAEQMEAKGPASYRAALDQYRKAMIGFKDQEVRNRIELLTQKTEKAFQKSYDQADAFFRAKEYALALSKYSEALALMPETASKEIIQSQIMSCNAFLAD